VRLVDPRHTPQIKEKDEMTKLEYLVNNDEGQDVVEYALLAAFISIVAIATLTLIGPLVDGIYQRIQTALASA
jgi:Flp pilus assembly pilin Flp